MSKKRKAAVYHPFTHLPDNYSLTHIVLNQLRMLNKHGWDTNFITHVKMVNADLKEYRDLEGVTVHAVLDKDPLKEADKAVSEMDRILTHDVIYLHSYKQHEIAVRKWIERYPKIRWLHWIHSAPNVQDKRPPIPNSRYIGMNFTDLPLLAEQFQVPLNQCSVVYNPVDPGIYFDWHPFTRHLVEKYELLDCDVLITYPLDTGRFEAKGGFKILKLVEHMRKINTNAKVIFVNAAANDVTRTKFVENLHLKYKEYAVFTSLERMKSPHTGRYAYPYNVFVPRRIVRELFQISNLFPLLSMSEGCSLIMLEAGMCGNLVVLNEDFPPMREFGEINMVVYMKTSSNRATTNYHPSEDSYYKDFANVLTATLEKNHALAFKRKVLQKFNPEWLWKNMLEPLLQ